MKKRNDIQHSESMWKGASASIFQNAKSLRDNPTEGESLLWELLKNNQVNGFKFRRQHPIMNYVADFYCHQLKIIIEIDGGYHNSEEQKIKDEERTKDLNFQGIRIIRFTNEEVLLNTKSVLETIKQEINEGS